MANFNGNIPTPANQFNLLVEYTITQTEEAKLKNYSDVTAVGYVKRNNANAWPYNTVSNAVLDIGGNALTTHPAYDLSTDGYKQIISHSARIYHDEDGKKEITISFSFDGLLSSYYPIGSVSQKITLPTIPRKSGIACSSPNIEDTAIITIDRKSPDFTDTVTYEIGDITGVIAEKTSNTVLSLDTSLIAEEIYALIPNLTEIKGVINCTTYNEDEEIGTSSCEFNLYTKKSICSPEVDGTIIDTNDISIALTEGANKFIKYVSKPKVTVNATSKKNASIKSYSINLNDGQVQNVQEYTFPTIGSNSVTVNAIDSREYDNPKTIDLSDKMIDYVQLHIDKISLDRTEDASNEVVLNMNGVWFNGKFSENNTNQLNLAFKYKTSEETNWTDGEELTATIKENTFNIQNLSLGNIYDYQKEYHFKVIVSDLVMTVGDATGDIQVVEKGQEVVAIGDDEVWVYGTLNLNDTNILDVIYPVGSIYISTNDINPKTIYGGEWEQIKDKFLLACGDDYKLGETGGEAEHILTVEEMPKHRHHLVGTSYSQSGNDHVISVSSNQTINWDITDQESNYTGEDKAHNNMPPYLAVYIWKRVS